MSQKPYVGNLGYTVTDSDLEQMFAADDTVQWAQVAIAALNGKKVGGRTLTVNVARPRTEGARAVGAERPRGELTAHSRGGSHERV